MTGSIISTLNGGAVHVVNAWPTVRAELKSQECPVISVTERRTGIEIIYTKANIVEACGEHDLELRPKALPLAD